MFRVFIIGIFYQKHLWNIFLDTLVRYVIKIHSNGLLLLLELEISFYFTLKHARSLTRHYLERERMNRNNRGRLGFLDFVQSCLYA